MPERNHPSKVNMLYLVDERLFGLRRLDNHLVYLYKLLMKPSKHYGPLRWSGCTCLICDYMWNADCLLCLLLLECQRAWAWRWCVSKGLQNSVLDTDCYCIATIIEGLDVESLPVYLGNWRIFLVRVCETMSRFDSLQRAGCASGNRSMNLRSCLTY